MFVSKSVFLIFCAREFSLVFTACSSNTEPANKESKSVSTLPLLLRQWLSWQTRPDRPRLTLGWERDSKKFDVKVKEKAKPEVRRIVYQSN